MAFKRLFFLIMEVKFFKAEKIRKYRNENALLQEEPLIHFYVFPPRVMHYFHYCD